MSETQSQPVQRSVAIPRILVRITFLIQIVLGFLFWGDKAKSLVPVHVTSGIILVISLWALAVAAYRVGVERGFVVFAAVWGVIVIGLGASQTNILHGGAHWIIQVVHLLVGLAAVALAEQLATKAIAKK
jgi:hypothetical protein